VPDVRRAVGVIQRCREVKGVFRHVD
jgi:hypothetical protein